MLIIYNLKLKKNSSTVKGKLLSTQVTTPVEAIREKENVN